MKTCIDCQSMAVWNLASAGIGEEQAYCDSCVPRGCSCNFIPDGACLVEDLGEDGRSLPCCEYLYSEDGFED